MYRNANKATRLSKMVFVRLFSKLFWWRDWSLRKCCLGMTNSIFTFIIINVNFNLFFWFIINKQTIYIYIYIYIYEIGSSYTWCNSYKLTPFLHRRFLRNLMVKKTLIKYYCFLSYYLINTSILSLIFIDFTKLPKTRVSKWLSNSPWRP